MSSWRPRQLAGLFLSSVLLLIAAAEATATRSNWMTRARRTLAPLAVPILCLGLSTPTNCFAAGGTLAEQLAALQAAQSALDAQDVEWSPVSSNPTVLFRDYRLGKEGGVAVGEGSTVATEMSVRMKSFATAKEPGGVRYYSTKVDTPANELLWTLGQGTLLAPLEDGMKGMTKGSLRRVEVPSTLVFKARAAGQLPLPAENDDEGKRRFGKLFKTDATLIFEVLVKSVSSKE